MRFKYWQLKEHRKNYDGSRIHVVHDPSQNEDEDDSEHMFDHEKSRYYMLTQKGKETDAVEFAVKQFSFEIGPKGSESRNNLEPSMCKLEREIKFDIDSKHFDLKSK